MASDKDQNPGAPDDGSDRATSDGGGTAKDTGQEGDAPEVETPVPRGLSWWQRRKERQAKRAEALSDLAEPTAPDDPAMKDESSSSGSEGRSTARSLRRRRQSGMPGSGPQGDPQAPDGPSRPDPRASGTRDRETRRGGEQAQGRVTSLDDLSDLDDSELAELPDPPPSVLRRLPWWAYVGAAAFLLVVALVLWGEVNSQRYYLVCRGNTAEAHQGRSFPWPFGHSALPGPLYRPVPLHVETQCEPLELDSEDQLQQSLLTLLFGEAERRRGVSKLGDLRQVRRLLAQGFGLARGDKTWVGRLRALQAQFDLKEGILLLREMEASLVEARRLLDRARHPRDAAKTGTSEDPELWIALVDHILDRLRAGRAPIPRDEPPQPAPVPSRDATAPAGPPKLPASPDPGTPLLPEEPPRPALPILPDASVKGGGILL